MRIVTKYMIHGRAKMELLIKGGRIVDCNKDFVGDLLIKDGKIAEFGSEIGYDCQTINAEGLTVLPAFIDTHVHFRDPGYTYKEDIYTGSLAALKGGYTCVNLMANTNPVCSSMETVDYVLKKSRELDLIDVHQTVSITKDFDGKTLDHLDSIDKTVKFISDDGKGVKDNAVMYRAMLKAKDKGMTVISHVEDDELARIDSRLSENIMTIRDVYLAGETKAKFHLAHVSTKEAMQEVIKAKKEGFYITCEVTPHHIALYDNDYKVNPPIRGKSDVMSLKKAIRDGWVDVIATDHAPHTACDKEKGACGISGLETAFPVSYTSLVKDEEITLAQLSFLMSGRAGEIMDISKGKIQKGYDGDVVLIDIDKKVKVDSTRFISKGKNTPFDGMEFYGEILGTIRKGKIMYDGGMKIDNR